MKNNAHAQLHHPPKPGLATITTFGRQARAKITAAANAAIDID
jgi:hypothetical protein